MRYLILILLSCVSAFAVPVPVQSNIAEYSTATVTATVTISPTAGNFLAVSCFAAPASGSTEPTITVSDNKSNSYSQAVQSANLATTSWAYLIRGALWYATNITGTGSFTITCAPSVSSFVTVIVSEYSGIATASPIDQTAVGTATTGTAAASGSATTTQADELIIGVVMLGGSATITAGTSFTIRREEESDATVVAGALEDRIVSSTGSYNASATLGASVPWYVMMATFKSAAGGGGGTPARRRPIVVM